jgi:hypothetical protein
MYPQYLPEYAQQLLDHMSRGLSFESFAAVLDLSTHRLISWCACHVDFREAREIGRAKSLYYWETQMRDYQDNPEGKPKFNFAYWKYNVSSQFPHLYGTKTAAYYQQLENEIYGIGYGEMPEVNEPIYATPTAELTSEAAQEIPQIAEVIEIPIDQPQTENEALPRKSDTEIPDSEAPLISTITDWDAKQAILFDLVQRDGENTPKTEEEFVAMMTQFNQSEVHEPPTAPMITKAVIPPRISNRHKRHRSKYHR